MKSGKLFFWVSAFYIFGIMCGVTLFAQPDRNTIVIGSVIDAKSGAPLPAVTVVLDNTSVGTITDQNGHYKIVTIATSYKISFSFVGYKTETHVIYPGKTQVINVKLKPKVIALQEISVKPERLPYHNKDNPAVELIDKVIAHKDQNRMKDLDYYSCSKYEKIAISLSNLGKNVNWPNAFSQIQLLLNNVDSSRADGKKNIPFYIKETSSDLFYRGNPKANKEIVRAEKTIHIDKYIDNKGLTANIKYLYQDIDIYSNDIFFLSNKFLSPIAPSAPVFYRYFIVDTSMVGNVSCIQVFFEPRNKSDFLFHGFLFITADSAYAIKKIDMSFNKAINIDWVNDVRIVQDFDKIPGKSWVLSLQDISVDFGLSRNMPGMYGQREVWYNNFSVNQPIEDSVFKGPDKIYRLSVSEDLPGYWKSVREAPLPEAQQKLYTIVDSIQKNPAFRHRMNVVMLLTTGFLNLGKFEIGPSGTFYSFNPVEGPRVKFGGRSTEEFNNRIYLNSYLAYGFRDQQYKYNLGLTYSLSGKTIYKFPVKSVSINYRYDTETPGVLYQYASEHNLLYSFKRGVDDKLFYNRSLNLEYLNEYENHLSFGFGYNYTELTPGGSLHFTPGGDMPVNSAVPYITTPEMSLMLRFAPKEEIYQGKIYRTRVASKYPVLQFRSTLGSKTLNNEYDYMKLTLGISKRFYFSIIGYSDVDVEAGKLFGKVPYPLLFIHNANQTYVYQENSYNMMNFLEFVSDRYFSLNIDHSFNGFIFNKIPLIKKLKLREVATLKMLYGGLGSTNNPAYHNDLFRFPTNAAGSPTTFTLDSKPYIEGSIGVSNIFRVIRVDLIKRFSYLNNPNVSSLGLRVQFKIDI